MREGIKMGRKKGFRVPSLGNAILRSPPPSGHSLGQGLIPTKDKG